MSHYHRRFLEVERIVRIVQTLTCAQWRSMLAAEGHCLPARVRESEFVFVNLVAMLLVLGAYRMVLS